MEGRAEGKGRSEWKVNLEQKMENRGQRQKEEGALGEQWM